VASGYATDRFWRLARSGVEARERPRRVYALALTPVRMDEFSGFVSGSRESSPDRRRPAVLVMTGSVKSGLIMVLIEEVLRAQIPVIVVD